MSIYQARDTLLSVPDPYGALILKSAAHKADSRNPERHLEDAAVLLACIDDPFADRAPSGSDRSRLLHLRTALADPYQGAWMRLPEPHLTNAQDALRILCEHDEGGEPQQ